jgi:lysozyme
MSNLEEAIKIAREVLVKPFEGYHKRLANGTCTAYPDPGTGGHPWTIGWGSTGPGIKKGVIWTQDQAEQALDHHLEYFLNGVIQLSPGLLDENPEKIAALISFAYNCGLGNYRISTLKKRVDSKNWNSAAYEIKRWNKAAGRVLRGLTRRREAEAMLLLS